MSWFNKAFSFLFGNAAGGIIQPIADVYKAKAEAQGDEAKAAADDLASARQFATPLPGSGNGVFNDLVDAANRLVRPVTSFYVLGGFAGAWQLPDLTRFDPGWVMAGQIILTFWFGGRMIVKDLPQGLAAALALYNKVRGK